MVKKYYRNILKLILTKQDCTSGFSTDTVTKTKSNALKNLVKTHVFVITKNRIYKDYDEKLEVIFPVVDSGTSSPSFFHTTCKQSMTVSLVGHGTQAQIQDLLPKTTELSIRSSSKIQYTIFCIEEIKVQAQVPKLVERLFPVRCIHDN